MWPSLYLVRVMTDFRLSLLLFTLQYYITANKSCWDNQIKHYITNIKHYNIILNIINIILTIKHINIKHYITYNQIKHYITATIIIYRKLQHFLKRAYKYRRQYVSHFLTIIKIFKKSTLKVGVLKYKLAKSCNFKCFPHSTFRKNNFLGN